MNENSEDKSDNIIPCEKITIKGKGTGHDYYIYIDGKKVKNCRAVGFYVDASSIGVVQLEIYGDEVEIEMEDGVVLKKNAFDDDGEEAAICADCGDEFDDDELNEYDGDLLCTACTEKRLKEEME